MSNTTARKGIQATIKKLQQLGATNIIQKQEGNKKFIVFQSPVGKEFVITTRAKTSVDWQTSINYGKETKENANEKDYWIFVDLSKQPNDFYIVPLWWIQNDIYKVHTNYLNSNGGIRKKNPNSKHHKVNIERIEQWYSRWDLMSLKQA